MKVITYLNGKRVTKEDIRKTEIKSEKIRKILRDKLTTNQE